MSENDKEMIDPLSPLDAAAVDALLDKNSPAGASGEDGRAARVGAWLKVLGSVPAPAAPSDLAARTFAAVQADAMTFPTQGKAAAAFGGASPSGPPGLWRRRLAEVGAMAVAAMLLVAVTLQGVGQAQRSQARVACANNLAKLSGSFSDYGQFCNMELPALAMPANGNWLFGNTPMAARNNTANLIPLVNHNFAPMSAFYCPGAAAKAPPPAGAPLLNELPAITYSYRNLYGPQSITWDGKHETIILADKNPLFTPEARTTAGGEQANSPNHGGHGNYLLRADGAATWETHPNVGPDHDNIWTLGTGSQRLLTYTGVEVPASAADVMLSP